MTNKLAAQNAAGAATARWGEWARRRFWVATALALMGLAACSWFEDQTPEFVRVTIDGDSESVVLITSTRFITATNELGEVGVSVFSSDTTHAATPFDQTFDVRSEHRFLLIGFPSADGEEATVRLQIMIDDETDYDRTITVSTDDPVQYIYLFNQAILQEFELL